MLITAKTQVKTALDEHPELKEILIEMSPKFSKLNNKLIYKTVAKWATFNDVAKIGGISICILLHKLNEKIGTADELAKVFPECIDAINFGKVKKETAIPKSSKIIEFDTRTREDYFLPELTKIIKTLNKNEAVKVISTFDPIPLKRMIESLGYDYSTEELNPDLFETYIFINGNTKKGQNINIKPEKVPIVIQSATSIATPVILRLLNSKKLKNKLKLKN
jgi:NitT/TauT family transport system substrate-binding protein